MEPVLEKLSGGDRRSFGRANEVVTDILNDPALFPLVFEGMLDNDPVIRMRAADVVEKVTSQHPEWLQPYKQRLLRELAAIEQPEVRWHLAQILARLDLNGNERGSAVQILLGFIQEKNSIVRTFAMQSLVDITKHDPELRLMVIGLMESLIYEGTPAMKTRGSKLLEQMRKEESNQNEHTT